MDFSLSDELRSMQQLARQFTEEKIVPYADKWDEDHHFPVRARPRDGRAGFLRLPDPRGVRRQRDGLSRPDAAVRGGRPRLLVAARGLQHPVSREALSIVRYGTADRKKRWVPDLIRGNRLGCFAISEPNAGSDVMSMASTAVPDGDGFVLNGAKTWISLATRAAWRSLLEAGARLAFGSDYPVESPDPLRGLYAAVTRQDDRGNPPDGWTPAQKLTLAERSRRSRWARPTRRGRSRSWAS